MNMKNFKVDFAQRTLEILKDHIESTPYDVTLMLNCLAGTVILPTEEAKASERSKNFRKFIENSLQKYGESRKSRKPSFKCIRNAISHMNVEVGSDNDNTTNSIDKITFKDRYNYSDNFHTEIEFSVENFKKFVLEVCEEYLRICSNTCKRTN